MESSVADAGRTARTGHGQEGRPGRFRLGSEQHKALFCRMVLDTFDPYKPAVIDWPTLDPDARARLVSLPIWDIAVQTEGKARLRVVTYGETVSDPLLKEAIALNGFEEGRHKDVLANMVRAYGIELAEEPPYVKPRDAEWAFMVTGYSECIDSFFASRRTIAGLQATIRGCGGPTSCRVWCGSRAALWRGPRPSSSAAPRIAISSASISKRPISITSPRNCRGPSSTRPRWRACAACRSGRRCCIPSCAPARSSSNSPRRSTIRCSRRRSRCRASRRRATPS